MTALLLSTLIFLLIISIAICIQSNSVPPVDFSNSYSSFSQVQQLKGKACVKGQCLPGNCLEVLGRATCLCPDGFTSGNGRCVARQCSIPHLCHPGVCIIKNKRTCLCPKGYTASDSLCKRTGKCYHLDCRPGICTVENETEKCLCPSGYTVKDDTCIEITLKTANVMTTVMLMIIVAGASVTLTALFGISICYYYSQRNEIQ